MKKKKIFTKEKLSLCFLLTILLVLSGCNNKNTSAEETPQPTKEAVRESEPVKQETQSPVFGEFESMDLEGANINESIFSEHTLTMVNIWATYCSPCINEMPELGELSEEYKEKGVQMVGIVSDVLDSNGKLDDTQVETAKEIVSLTKANYPHILPSMDLMIQTLSKIYVVPTTIFVDQNGYQVGEVYEGARTKEQWKTIIEELLPLVNKTK